MTQELSKHYQIHDEIGRGRFGIVYRCTSITTGDSFAVKSIDKNHLTSKGDFLDCRCLLVEPTILQHLSLSPHRNLINLHALYEDDSHLHIVIDLCSGFDLLSHIGSRTGALSETECRSIMLQLMDAIAHIHRLGVVHRDIKPDNLVFDSSDCLKLVDFGSAEVNWSAAITGVVGTPYYVAPEVLAGAEYGEKVDVWSAGIVMYVMLAGFPPFDGETPVEIFNSVSRANLRFPIKYFKSVSPAAKDLLRKMICKDVSRRFSAEQVLSHGWMKLEMND